MHAERERARRRAPHLRSCRSGGSLPALLEGSASAACFATAPAPPSAASNCKIPQVPPCLLLLPAPPSRILPLLSEPLSHAVGKHGRCGRPVSLYIPRGGAKVGKMRHGLERAQPTTHHFSGRNSLTHSRVRLALQITKNCRRFTRDVVARSMAAAVRRSSPLFRQCLDTARHTSLMRSFSAPNLHSSTSRLFSTSSAAASTTTTTTATSTTTASALPQRRSHDSLTHVRSCSLTPPSDAPSALDVFAAASGAAACPAAPPFALARTKTSCLDSAVYRAAQQCSLNSLLGALQPSCSDDVLCQLPCTASDPQASSTLCPQVAPTRPVQALSQVNLRESQRASHALGGDELDVLAAAAADHAAHLSC